MSQEFQAIYENGMLRLNQPLDLPENSPVRGVVEGDLQTPPKVVLLQQQEALRAMLLKLAALPQTPSSDGLSGRDHDAILYGQQ